jgi:uncharacterized protein (DUF885 family)
MLADLHARFDGARLSRAARTDVALLESALSVDAKVKRAVRPLERRPDLYASPMQALFLMAARDYAPASERAANALARIEKLPATVALARTNLGRPPRVWTQVAIEQSKGAAAFFDEQRSFLEASLPSEKPRIGRAIADAKSAYAAYAAYLQKDVLPRGGDDFAAGRELFEFLLRENYFLDKDSDALLALGRRLLTETEAQMTETARRIDAKAKGWPEVVRRLKAKHPTAEDLIASYARELSRARKFLVDKDAVDFPPGDDCQVIETPPFLRSTITAAYDPPPPLDAVTKGYFFVTPVDKSLPKAKKEEILRENDHGDQVDTAVHEAYPGHHLQLSFARRHPSLIRKIVDQSIFSEGWALYCEMLMGELGYYTDEERLLVLQWQLVRAARVVIDVGLHTRGMNFDEAMKILTDDVHLEHELALSEVKRYTMDPTQPLSYLVGREMIVALRDKYKAREGAAFTLKRFHTELLSHGTMSPGLIEREMF